MKFFQKIIKSSDGQHWNKPITNIQPSPEIGIPSAPNIDDLEQTEITQAKVNSWLENQTFNNPEEQSTSTIDSGGGSLSSKSDYSKKHGAMTKTLSKAKKTMKKLKPKSKRLNLNTGDKSSESEDDEYDRWKTKYKYFIHETTLGSGNFGEVKKMKNSKNGKSYAVKSFKRGK